MRLWANRADGRGSPTDQHCVATIVFCFFYIFKNLFAFRNKFHSDIGAWWLSGKIGDGRRCEEVKNTGGDIELTQEELEEITDINFDFKPRIHSQSMTPPPKCFRF